MPTDERVLGIPAAHLAAWGPFLGLRAATPAERDWLLDPSRFEFRPRSECETDPSFVQLIPYVVLTCLGRVFHYRRGDAGTEARLKSLRSVGIGGHVSEADAAGGADPYLTGLRREVAEEVAIGAAFTERFLGFLRDDRTPVGEVHLGVVHQWELTDEAAEPRESALAGAGWAEVAACAAASAEFETWSQFALAALEQERRATSLVHEVWEEVEDTGTTSTVCLAGPRGDGHRTMLGVGARLVTTIVANSWTEAMTRYYRYQGWGVYRPEPDWPVEPYPAAWVAEQRAAASDHPAGGGRQSPESPPRT